MTVRDLAAGDEPRWRELWADFLEFYEHPLPEEVTATTLTRLLAREDGMRGQVAVADDGKVVGFVHTVVHAGTWSVAPRCYLEDLFVAADVRGTGAGRALIEAARTHAAALGCSEVYWITESGNATARRLYDRVAKLADYVRYEIELG
ncbi:GNAT family N-acetyltransferase [Nitriliruptor alkaliphilus]|uniref:GNAT family N-acetyltransferase n=1 Tax=Nitriliruptor alkaliphilus TaxID=427918 RepID=UPI000695B6F3|nr:GNAT family N-acetyltransferase [Nitriliruptor alkaliphilus]